MNLSIAEAILEATSVLRGAGVADGRLEAGSLLANVLGRDRTFLITRADELLRAEDLEVLRRHVARRARGEPLQYITGYQEFFGLDFEVNKHVLIPRPETELLVETALELIGDVNAAPLICDLGTGSGCIAIALLHERPAGARGRGRHFRGGGTPCLPKCSQSSGQGANLFRSCGLFCSLSRAAQFPSHCFQSALRRRQRGRGSTARGARTRAARRFDFRQRRAVHDSCSAERCPCIPR